MLDDPRIDIIVKQFQIFAVLLSRPVVQRQIAAIVAIFLIAWLINRLINAFVHPKVAQMLDARLIKQRKSRFYRLLMVIKWLYFPITGLLLVPIIVWLFGRWQFPAGLIQNAAAIFWILLVYEIIMGLLDLWFSQERVEAVRSRILIPLFVLLPGYVFLNQFIDLPGILSIEIVNVLNAQITLGRLLTAVLWFYSFTIVSWLIVEALQKVILPRTQANMGIANSILTIVRYSFKIAAVLVVFGVLGVDLTSLALIGTGLTVGIGFGLQQVIANFMSGILLLFEQSLRPGDMIEINNQLGIVQQLNIRATSIRTIDSEIIVPNEMFLNSQLTTYTKSNLFGRVLLPIGVSYDSDPQRVRQILLETAVEHGLVRTEPPPVVFFDGFSDFSLDFTLAAWIDDPWQRRIVLSDLNFMVWNAMADNGITIPFPQRDLNLREGWEGLAQTMHGRTHQAPPDTD
ncbi:MAG: mechanosensitive ion channel [Chloroflexi bacterium]|nr:mechanosensitive ion channel [Chloroflexota bacterium]